MGETTSLVHASANHHTANRDGDLRGQRPPEFVFPRRHDEVRLKTGPGDYIFVPPSCRTGRRTPTGRPGRRGHLRRPKKPFVVNLPKLYHYRSRDAMVAIATIATHDL